MKEMSAKLLPRKAEFMCIVLELKGQSLAKLKNFDKAVDTFLEEVKVATERY